MNIEIRTRSLLGLTTIALVVAVSVILTWPAAGDTTDPSPLTVTMHPYIDIWLDDNWFMTYSMLMGADHAVYAFVDDNTMWVVETAISIDDGVSFVVVAPIDVNSGAPISSRALVVRSPLTKSSKAVAADFDPESGVTYILGSVETHDGRCKAAFVLAYDVREEEVVWYRGFSAGQEFGVEDITFDNANVWVTGWIRATEADLKDALLIGFRRDSGELVGSVAFGSEDFDEVGRGVAAYNGKVVIAGEMVSEAGQKVGLMIYERDFRIIASEVIGEESVNSWFNDVGILRVADIGGGVNLYAIAVGALDDGETVRLLAVEWMLRDGDARYSWGQARRPILRDWTEAVPAEALAVHVDEEYESLGSDFAIVSGRMFNPNTGRYMAISYVYTMEGYYTLAQSVGTHGDLASVTSFYISREVEPGVVDYYLYMIGTEIGVSGSNEHVFSARVMVSRYFVETLDWRTCPSLEGVSIDLWVTERDDVITSEKELIVNDVVIEDIDPHIGLSYGSLLRYCEAFTHRKISIMAWLTANASQAEMTVTVTETTTVTQTVTHENLSIVTVTENHYQTVTVPRTETVTQTVIGTCTAQNLTQVMEKQEETTRMLYAVAGVTALTLITALLAIVKLKPR